MLLSLLVLLAALPEQGFQTDTSFAVSQGSRLRVENQGGDIIVRAWDKNQVRVQAAHSRRTHISISISGAVVALEAEADRGPANMVDYQITVPAWMALDLEGMYATIDVTGVRGSVVAETLEGDITVKAPAQSVNLSSTSGKLVVQGIRGTTTLNTTSEDIEASDITGDIVAETISGDILLRGINAKSVEVETLSGELYFDGRIMDGGRYSLLTHSGEITVSVAEGTNATVATAVGSGEVSASFPLPASERPSRRRQTFRIGSGSATVELETFSGEIRLLRPAELAARLDRIMQAREERMRAKQKVKPEHDDEHDHDLLDHRGS